MDQERIREAEKIVEAYLFGKVENAEYDLNKIYMMMQYLIYQELKQNLYLIPHELYKIETWLYKIYNTLDELNEQIPQQLKEINKNLKELNNNLSLIDEALTSIE